MKQWKDAVSEDFEEYRKFVSEREKDIGAFISFEPDKNRAKALAQENTEIQATSGSDLEGLPFAVKDNISVRNMGLTCGSKFLENFRSPYSATVIHKLTAAGANPVGKTNLDEFGMGSSSDNSALGTTNNPWNLQRVAGGSSGGSAAAVAAGLVPFALGSDTGGSVRQPAAFCGVYGLKPTYGALSRYGLVAYASSLDVIGIVSGDIEIMKSSFECMRGKDAKDNTSVDYRQFPVQKADVKRIGVLTGELGLSDEVAEGYRASIEALRKAGYQIAEVELPSLQYTVPAYYTIATAEASANLARFNGVRYGERPVYAENPDELVRKSRDLGFGPEVKLRILLGTYVLRSGFQDRYYHKALAIRNEIRNDFRQMYEQVDLLMLPVFPVQAFEHGASGMDAFQQKVADRFTTAANLTGLPALSCPGPLVSGLPTAVQFMAPAFGEDLLFKVGRSLSAHFPVETPPAYPSRYALS